MSADFSAEIQSRPAGCSFFADARARGHAPVARQSDLPETEAVPDLVDLPTHRRRIGRVAFEHFDRDRASLAVAQEPVGDLLLVAPAVAAEAAREHLVLAPLHVARAQIVENQRKSSCTHHRKGANLERRSCPRKGRSCMLIHTESSLEVASFESGSADVDGSGASGFSID